LETSAVEPVEALKKVVLPVLVLPTMPILIKGLAGSTVSSSNVLELTGRCPLYWFVDGKLFFRRLSA